MLENTSIELYPGGIKTLCAKRLSDIKKHVYQITQRKYKNLLCSFGNERLKMLDNNIEAGLVAQLG